ncbi:DUF2269 domain-containing protein [Streptomyces hainanensis]|uniref:DUF2269 domain-containing protein n=1 Tax=Streptomyces hainanensis TaxID=402648 RepID=A0A4V6PBU2_9ACTN|nr:DUF2269 domain-containing protein [Streptomyces hainanensis]TDC76205.1 DUF2269 domain-containing protein [Streptomyces hainanensis]
MRELRRPVRRALLVGHVVVSVGWLGLTLCLLVLGIAGATTGSAATAEAAYRAMNIFGDWLIAPLALTTFASGLVLSLGTPWGLARYRWVYAKFWLTLGAGLASLFLFRAGIADAAAEVAAGRAVSDPAALVAPPVVSLSLYLFMTAISVLKPWGPTRRGRVALAARRGKAATRTTRTGRTGKTARVGARASATVGR